MTTAFPGWYDDPAGLTKQRYWDGEEWDGRPEGGGRWPDPVAPEPRVASTTQDGEPLARWGRRGAALVVDWLLVFLLWAPVARLWGLDVIGAWFDGVDGARDEPVVELSTWGAVSLAVVGAAVHFAYVVGFLLWKQATPGKLLTGLRVRRRADPGPLSFGTAALRWFAQFGPARLAYHPVALVVVAVLAVLDHGWPLWDRNRQALHDKVAGTQVVRCSSTPRLSG
ncbi:RDD family protein [Nocardioides plantarum]|uniref:RDD family protein n=1 Tax=Nocardioides plantarum TaxID=29299 RepID=A0ABV5K9T4_9ACTN|nr:RDD family protein [Nocardioides plantarum]